MAKAQSGEQEKKVIMSAVKKILKAPLLEEKQELIGLLQANKIKPTNANGIALAMVLKALGGDKQSAEWVREASGEKEKDEVKVGETLIIISGDDKIAE